MIIVSILGAFALDSWYENQKKHQLGKEVLAEIKLGLKRDLIDLEANYGGHKSGVQSQKIVLDWLNSNLPFKDSLCRHFGKAQITTGFIASDGAFETLKSLGFNLITNDSLRNHISMLYDVQYDYYLGVESWYEKSIYYFINEVNERHLDQNNCPTEPAKIKMANDFKYHLKKCKGKNQILTAVIKQTKTDVEKLIVRIEKELD